MKNENLEVKKILLEKAKSWWHFKNLRSVGKIQEAEKLENDNVQSNYDFLMNVKKSNGWASIGRGGWGIYGDRYHYMSGYEQKIENSAMIQVCIILGIPVCDSTKIPDDKIINVIRFPMASGKDTEQKDKYYSMDYAPFPIVFQMYQELGAELYNL